MKSSKQLYLKKKITKTQPAFTIYSHREQNITQKQVNNLSQLFFFSLNILLKVCFQTSSSLQKPDQNSVVGQLLEIKEITVPHRAWENALFSKEKTSSCKQKRPKSELLLAALLTMNWFKNSYTTPSQEIQKNPNTPIKQAK